MAELENFDVQHTTEWALLFPLRTGLLSLKSSFNSLVDGDSQNDGLGSIYKTEYLSQQNINLRKATSENSSARSSVENLYQFSKLKIRRRSSMSDLDKIEGLKTKVSDVTRLVTSHSYEQEYSSTPNSPQTYYIRHIQNSQNVCGSIGDFMNFKRFGGSSGVRTESIIAKTVPLTTVTKKIQSKNSESIANQINEDENDLESSENSTKGSQSSFEDSKSSSEAVDGYSKANRSRKCGVAFSENIIMQHFVKNICALENSSPENEGENLNNHNEDGRSSLSQTSDSANSSPGPAGVPIRNGCDRNSPLSGSQRTERLSRIIKQHHSTRQLYANINVSVWAVVCLSLLSIYRKYNY